MGTGARLDGREAMRLSVSLREGSDITLRRGNLVYLISIHASAKGATRSDRAHDLPCRNFNPRSREGSDGRPGAGKAAWCIFQSTLPRRERPRFASSIFTFRLFQSTLPRRERPRLRKTAKRHAAFQSTLPRRERPIDDCARAHERRRQVSPSSARANTIP